MSRRPFRARRNDDLMVKRRFMRRFSRCFSSLSKHGAWGAC
jgi:hypothetical protein